MSKFTEEYIAKTSALTLGDLYGSGWSGYRQSLPGTFTVEGSSADETFTIKPILPMTKTSYLIIAAGSNSIAKILTDVKLDAAKAEARRLAHRDQAEYLVCKAIFACAPKVDVTEEDL